MNVIQQILQSDMRNMHNIVYHLSHYFPRPIEFLELVILHKLVVSGCIADSFRFQQVPYEESFIYYRQFDKDEDVIEATLARHLLAIQQTRHVSRKGSPSYFMANGHRINLINCGTRSEISICEAIIIKYIRIQLDPVLLTCAGSHVIQIQNYATEVDNNIRMGIETAVDERIWHESNFMSYDTDSMVVGKIRVPEYDAILKYIS